MREGNGNSGRVEILLVEDRPADVTQTLAALKKANVFNPIHVLRSTEECADFIFRTGHFSDLPPLPQQSLVLLSLNLAGTSGLDLLGRLKADQRTLTLPVIMLTSCQEERGVMQSYKLGASGCIVKPLTLEKLVEVASELRLGWLLVSPPVVTEKPPDEGAS